MATWLGNDLANNPKDWLVVFFHHPPYSRGSPNSDRTGVVRDSFAMVKGGAANALPAVAPGSALPTYLLQPQEPAATFPRRADLKPMQVKSTVDVEHGSG